MEQRLINLLKGTQKPAPACLSVICLANAGANAEEDMYVA
jgi:hypothetical protein